MPNVIFHLAWFLQLTSPVNEIIVLRSNVAGASFGRR